MTKPSKIYVVSSLHGKDYQRVDTSTDLRPFPGFKQDGFDTYVVELHVIGIESRVFMLVPGNDPEDACNVACESLASIKHKDMEIIQTKKVE